jgi:preprotein translocase subunit SecG
MNPFLAILMILTAIFLILLVLIQRGRGGGLAGAFGGMGGQSAFGTKAGDLFTRVTIGVAAFWIVLCIVSLKLTVNRGDQFDPNLGRDANATLPTQSGPGGAGTGSTTPAAKDNSKETGSSAASGAESKSSAGAAATTPADSGSKEAEKSDSSK